MKITDLTAQEILDSRGNPTVEVFCVIDNKFKTKASVPSGASTGIHEAVELRDQDAARYNGLGVQKVVSIIRDKIAPAIINKDWTQAELDDYLINLDGTKNKSSLGANAILGISLAFARSAALSQNIPLYKYIAKLSGKESYSLPLPMFNIINGGKHADSGLDIQEFMIAPIGIKGLDRQVQAACEITHSLKKILQQKNYTVGVGDEGGFAPQLKSNEEALELIINSITNAGYTTDQVKIAMDVAASSLYKNKMCTLKIDGTEQCISSKELIDWYKSLSSKYPIISIEDGLSEDDWDGFTLMNTELGDKMLIVGDDLTVTNIDRIKIAHDKGAINSVLIKLNQIGTLTETIQAIQLTQSYGWEPFISHRSGETKDTFIADLSVGMNCPYIKSGAPIRGERVAKYNRLLEIFRELDLPTTDIH